jgi:type I restriction enzyme S subunit
MKLPRYPKYKDSGVKWLGMVPEHWRIATVRSVSHLINGYPFDSALFDSSNGFPLIRIRDLNCEVSETYYNGEFVKAASITANDVLIGMDGDFNVGRWRGEIPALLNQRVCCVRVHEKVTSKLLEYALPTPLKVINDLTYSTTVKHLSSFQVEKIRIALPDEEGEKKLLVEFLDKEVGKIDMLVNEQRQLIDLLNEKRQAVISHAVTKGLNSNIPIKPSGIKWIGQIPEHWSVVSLKFMAYVQGGVAKGRNLDGQKTIEVPYLRVANVQDGYLDLNDVATIEIAPHELRRYSLHPGDVLMNEGGDYDKLGRGHIWHGEIPGCIHQNHVFAVRPHRIESEWLNLVTSAECGRFYFMSRSKQSTNLASISSTNIQELPVPCPPEKERLSIIEYVRKATKNIDLMIAEAVCTIDLFQERRSALISAAVTGQIDVRNYRPQEAPAVCQ